MVFKRLGLLFELAQRAITSTGQRSRSARGILDRSE
jgi:hypothetical protein